VLVNVNLTHKIILLRMISVSNDESVETNSLSVLITDHAVSTTS